MDDASGLTPRPATEQVRASEFIRTLLDTSVLVAALEAGHPRHAAARPFLEACHGGNRVLLVAAHALAEVYATLTVLPVSPRISRREAERLLQANVATVAEVVPLDVGDYEAVVGRMAALGLVSGAVYDGLHVRAAEKAQADELVTFNGQDFQRMPPGAPCRLVVL